MKGITFLVLCALALARASRIQLTSSGRLCNCDPGQANNVCSQSGSNGAFIVHENCNQYYRCVNGVPLAQTCAYGLVYNSYIERCDWAYNVDCGNKPIIPVEKDQDNEDDTVTGVCHNCNPIEAPQICANNPDGDVFVLHENCNQFYQCVYGRPVTKNCGPNTVYNPYIQRCDWFYNVDCGNRPIVEIEIDEDSNGSDPNEECEGWSCYCDPAEAPSICAGEGSDGTIIAHENCNQFYQCAHGKPVAVYCIPGYVFNIHIGRCDRFNSALCGNKPIVEIDEGGVSNENDVAGEGNGGNGSCNCNPSEAPGICSQDGSDGVLVAHENCNQYYKCAYGVPVTQNCPAGLMFDPYKERCEWPDTVQCGDRPIVEIEGGGNGDEDCEDSNGQGSGNGEGGSGGNGGSCNCIPGEAPGICSQDGSDGVLVAHENCNQFYKCAYGVPVTQNCPAGLLYDPYKERCEWPDTVECGDRPIVEIEDGGSGNGESGSGGNGTGSGNGEGGSGGNGTGSGNGEGGSGGNGGSCNCVPGEAPGICSQDRSDGVLVAHENCNQFYKCDHGVPVTQNCPAGLLYDPYKERCEWPDTVECGDRPIVEIEDGGSGNGESGSGGNGTGSGNGEGGSGGNGTGSGNGEGGSGGNGGSCNCVPGEAPGICSQDGSDGVLVAHENCNQFYKCDHGVPVTQNCPAGLLYDPYKERCEWPDTVECGDRPIVEIEEGGSGNGESGSGGNGTDSGNGEGGSGGNGGSCNCVPGEAPGICSQDGSDGVLVAHENCNQFYKCDYGVPVTQNCPAGLLYDPYKERCEWPDTVECGDRPIVEIEDVGSGNGESGSGGNGTGSGNGEGGSGGNGGSCNCVPGEAPGICSQDGSDGVLVAHENCNQFYKCAYGVPVTQNCPAGLLYDPYKERCEWPDTVECGDRPIVEIEDGGSGNGESGSGGNGTGSGNGEGGSGGNGGSCNCIPGEAPGICSQDGSDGVLVAHENCNQFYKCAYGVPVTQNCPAGLLYDPYKERCEWPDTVECGDRPIVEIEDGGSGNGESGSGGNGTGSGNGEGGSGGNGGSCNCVPGEAPGICSQDDSDGVLVAHENCNQFYKCAYGVPVTQNCPAGLLYDPYKERCEWPDTVECGDRPIVEIEDGGSGNGESGSGGNGTGSGNGEGGSGGNGGSCNCIPGEAPGICSQDDSDGVLVAHENCNQFYKCAYGVPVTQNCPAGLLYDPYKERCEWPDTVECGDRPIIEIEDESNGGESEIGSGNNDQGGNGGNNEDCAENDNNSVDCNCDPGQAANICRRPGASGTLIAHENCNQFYQCAHGIPVTQNCNKGLVYNPFIQNCDWPQNVNCNGKPIVEIDVEENDSIEDDGTNNEIACNCNPAEAPGICAAGGSDGVLIAHEKCNYFYQCSHGKPAAIKCPAGSLYNPYIRNCDLPDRVECGDRVISDSEEEEKNPDTENNINGHCDPSQAPAICAADASDDVLVAHEYCNQYFICKGGVPVALSCPNNLLYNPANEQCDWPYNVECGDRFKPDNGNAGGECACDARQARRICSDNQNTGKLVAHERCDKYYVCIIGTPVEFACPAPLLYDPHNEACNWASAVDCEGRITTSYYSLNKHLKARKGLV